MQEKTKKLSVENLIGSLSHDHRKEIDRLLLKQINITTADKEKSFDNDLTGDILVQDKRVKDIIKQLGLSQKEVDQVKNVVMLLMKSTVKDLKDVRRRLKLESIQFVNHTTSGDFDSKIIRNRREASPDPSPDAEPEPEPEPHPQSKPDGTVIEYPKYLDGFYQNHPRNYGRNKRSLNLKSRYQSRLRKGSGKGFKHLNKPKSGLKSSTLHSVLKNLRPNEYPKKVYYSSMKDHRESYGRSPGDRHASSNERNINEKKVKEVLHNNYETNSRVKRHLDAIMEMVGFKSKPKRQQSQILYMSAAVEEKSEKDEPHNKVDRPRKVKMMHRYEVEEPEPTLYKPTESYKKSMNKVKLVQVHM